jgi:hypothetical protein
MNVRRLGTVLLLLGGAAILIGLTTWAVNRLSNWDEVKAHWILFQSYEEYSREYTRCLYQFTFELIAHCPSAPLAPVLIWGGLAFALCGTVLFLSIAPQINSPTDISFDRNKWEALIKYDEQIAAIAEKLKPLGQKWVDEFARAYLELNDKSYLPNIVWKIIADARKEQETEPTYVYEGYSWRYVSDGKVEVIIDGDVAHFSDVNEFLRFVRVKGPAKTQS